MFERQTVLPVVDHELLSRVFRQAVIFGRKRKKRGGCSRQSAADCAATMFIAAAQVWLTESGVKPTPKTISRLSRALFLTLTEETNTIVVGEG